MPRGRELDLDRENERLLREQIQEYERRVETVEAQSAPVRRNYTTRAMVRAAEHSYDVDGGEEIRVTLEVEGSSVDYIVTIAEGIDERLREGIYELIDAQLRGVDPLTDAPMIRFPSIRRAGYPIAAAEMRTRGNTVMLGTGDASISGLTINGSGYVGMDAAGAQEWMTYRGEGTLNITPPPLADPAPLTPEEQEAVEDVAQRMEEDAQTSFLPETPPTAVLRNVELRHIQAHREEPSADFVENVRRLGILQPVALIQAVPAGGGYRIVEGRRRIGAMRQLGRETIPAYVFEHGTTVAHAAAMTLSANMQRRANPVREFAAIRAMVGRGLTEQQIASELRIPLQTVRARMRLANLGSALMTLFQNGVLAPSVAERAARLDGERQASLYLRYQQNGRITAADVREVTQVRDREAVEEMPEDLFRTPDLPTPQIETVTLAGAMEAGALDASGVEIELQIAGFDEGWAYVLAALRLAEGAIPATPDNATDEFMAQLDRALTLAAAAAGAR